MKKKMLPLCLCALLLAGCGADEQKSQGLQITGDIPKGAARCMKRYFTAVEQKDFEGYLATVYPPYQEAFGSYLEEHGETLENTFYTLSEQFDTEDSKNWHFTEIQAAEYENEEVADPIEDFFSAFVQMQIFDEDFVADCKADAKTICDVNISLYALYDGEKEPTEVVRNNEVILIENADGWHIIG